VTCPEDKRHTAGHSTFASGAYDGKDAQEDIYLITPLKSLIARTLIPMSGFRTGSIANVSIRNVGEDAME